LPSINALHEELKARGFTALLVDIQQDRDTVAKTVAARRYTAPVVLDTDGEITQAYGVRATPTLFLVGRDGALLGRAVGPRPWTGPEGRALLEALLADGQ
jgi:cytochrome c-type biogenesis protein